MDDRPNPDDLLARVQAEEAKQRHGKLKIFFGAAPGVGKTYAMLEAARKVAKEGANVVVGYVEPHARPETQALVLGLDLLPKRVVERGGRQWPEFDLAAALALKPQLIVVDELAHTNQRADDDSLVHAKRWQDVEALLAAGIDVFTTVNVQHLESLNDVVAKITGVIVRETIPDSVFEQADEVELVDLPPDDLIDRLQEGKVYVADQATRAIQNFFNKGNLIALRELALRKMAERVDRQMTDYRTDRSIRATWPAAERLLVCVGPGPSSASLVRATRRIAAGLRAPWLAAYVETPAAARLTPRDHERLAQTQHLARQLGGEIVTLGGTDVAGEIVAYARSRNVTRIIVGKTLLPRWREWLRGSFVYELTRRSGDIDVYVLSGESAEGKDRTAATAGPRPSLAGYGAALISVAICTAVCFGLYSLFHRVGAVTLSMVYLVGVVVVAVRHGRGPSTLAALLGVLVFDFFFIEPRFNFAVNDTQYVFTFIVMLATGILISTLTSRVMFQAELARRRERQAAMLYELARSLVQIDALADLAHVEEDLARVLGGEVFLLPLAEKESTKGESRLAAPIAASGQLSLHEQSVAEWVLKNGQAAGRGTDTLPSVGTLFVPLATSGGVVGVLGVRPQGPDLKFTPDQQRLIETVAGQLALAVERIRTAEAARQSRLRYEREELRNALLSAVSHDLRTPLAAIAGAGSTLVETSDAVTPEVRRELAQSIVAETDRLNRLVSNLLDMTRLEAGSLQLARDWHPLDDLVGAVVRRLARVLAQHPVAVDLPQGGPLVFLDELLFHQVLANLLENAARHAPAGSELRLAAGISPKKMWAEVSDAGPGFPPADRERIFEKFYRAEGQRDRKGTGLGLAICRGIVELHGGAIEARNRPEGGAAFRVELPQPPQPAPPPAESLP